MVALGLLSVGLSLVIPESDGDPAGAVDASDVAQFVQFTSLGLVIAWIPGATRSQSRMNAALVGTDDEVARIKYRVLRGKALDLTDEETERGRYLARVTAHAIPALAAFLLAMASAISITRFFDGEPLSSIFGAAVVALGLSFVIHLERRRRIVLGFLYETGHAAA
jgi:hypothetical protein